MSTGFGVLAAGVMLAWRDESLVMIVINRPMLLLSGAYLLLPTVPEPFRTLAWLNPIAYARVAHGRLAALWSLGAY